MNAPRLELVRCGCGLVRNDDDNLALPSPAIGWCTFAPPPDGVELCEAPRVCRGCGCVYMLPKPQAPSSPA